MNFLSKVNRGTFFQWLAILLVTLLVLVSCYPYLGYSGLATFAFITIVLASPLIAVRALAQWLSRDQWKKQYFRLSVDVGLICILILFIATVVPDHRGNHLPRVMQDRVSILWRQVNGWEHPQVEDRYNQLVSLTNLSWFLENLPLYVLLPATLVFLWGYTLERKKQPGKKVI
jgi:hypothetical protein